MSTEPSADAAPWYADGLRFECTQCGNCCSGPPGAVWVDDDDVRTLAARFRLSEAQFIERYTRRFGLRRSLNEVRGEHGHDCVFLDRTSRPGKAVCSIYEARPLQCRTWPFWRENIESREAWNEVKRRTPCPGMDRGRAYTCVEITIERERTR
jgi:Fe-S-cluster containining protein